VGVGVGVGSENPANGGVGPATAGSAATGGATADAAVVWHDLECGRYTADLALWRELADMAARGRAGLAESGRTRVGDAREQVGDRGGAGGRAADVLDVGAGTGRVALHLAAAGHRVTAVDSDSQLLAALRGRAADLDLQTVCADARRFELPRRDHAACLMPMQTVQLLGGEDGRVAFLRCARAHVRPGGLVACAIVTEFDTFDSAAGDAVPSPEIALVAGTHYISRPTRVSVSRWRIRIERERSVVTDEQVRSRQRLDPPRERNVIELDRVSARQLQREGRAAGLTPLGARWIDATDEHVSSEVVLLRA
jgi:SAM-dependent methyltransferase